jgi:hypothetical protein
MREWGWVIAALLGFASWRMAYLGMHVTIHPSTSRKGRSKKSVKKEFYFIAGISTVLIVLQAYRTDRAYSDLVGEINKKRNASITANGPAPTDGFQALTPGRQLQFNLGYIVSANTANNVRNYVAVYLAEGQNNSEEDRAIASRFNSDAAGPLEHRGQDLGVGSKIWRSPQTTILEEATIEKIMNGKTRLYMLGKVEWSNPDGSDSHTFNCGYLQAPPNENDNHF